MTGCHGKRRRDSDAEVESPPIKQQRCTCLPEEPYMDSIFPDTYKNDETYSKCKLEYSELGTSGIFLFLH